MEENHNEEHNIEKKEIKSCECGSDKWVKFALIVAAVFLGCYLAAYYVLDQIRDSYCGHLRPIPNIDNVIREQDKFFDDFEAVPIDLRATLPSNMPVVQTFKKDNSYKVVIDLMPFNNDPHSIKLDIKPDRISIYGEKTVNKKNTESDYTFSQNFSLPEKIDVKDVKKEVKNNKYIITLPIKELDD